MTLLEIRNKIRQDLEDYPSRDTLSANVNATAEQITVTLGKRFESGCFIQIDSEIMQVYGADENANTVALSRGMRNTTAATHTSGTAIIVNALFPDSEINDMIRESLGAIYPKIYRICTTTATTSATRTVTFTLLAANPAPLGLSQVWLRNQANTGTDYIWAPMKNWFQITDSITSIGVQFKQSIDTGFTVKAIWMAPWEVLTTDTGATGTTTLDSQYLGILSYYVCGRLGEKRLRKRLRFEGHSVDADPSKSSAADILGGAGFDSYRFSQDLENRKMAPLPFFLSNQHLY